MTSEDHNQLFTIFRLISKSQSRGAARPCFVFCLFSNASHPAEQYLRKRDVEHLAIGSCFEDGDSYGDGPSGVRGLSTSSRCLERTANIRLIDPGCVRPGTRNAKTTRSGPRFRGGEALSVASRGEHGHHPVITLPMNRFCPDRMGRRSKPGPNSNSTHYIPRFAARRLKLTVNPNPILHRRYECEPLNHPPPEPAPLFRSS